MKKFYRMKLFNFKGIQRFNSARAEKVELIDGYAAEKDKLDQSVANIEHAEDLLAADRKGVTQDTAKAKIAMAEAVIRIAHKALPLARNSNLVVLMNQLKRGETYLSNAAGLTALSRARVMYNAMVENNHVLTNVTADDIEEMGQKINAYSEVHQNPKILTETRKIEGSESIELEYQKAHIAVQNMRDFIYGHYKSSEPQLLKEFEDYLSLDSFGIHHNALKANCFVIIEGAAEPKQALVGVKLSIAELNTSALSDINGECQLSKFKAGTYHVTCSKEGYQNREFQLEFKNGHILELDVEMKKEG